MHMNVENEVIYELPSRDCIGDDGAKAKRVARDQPFIPHSKDLSAAAPVTSYAR